MWVAPSDRPAVAQLDIGRVSPRLPARPRTNADWSRATTDTLRRRARAEFAARGYADASLERIAKRAGVTKGAVYYHFRSKEGLFEAVFRDVEREIVERIETRAAAAADPVEAVVAGCLAFLDIAVDDALRQIALVDGPLVLGWSRWRVIDGEFGLGSLKEGLRAGQRAGWLRDVDPDVLAHLISGAVNEGVFLIAESDDRVRAYDALARTLTTSLRRLMGRPGDPAARSNRSRRHAIRPNA